MSKDEAIKILLKHGIFNRDRPGTGYGGPNIFECCCCGQAMNVGSGRHAKTCELAQVFKKFGRK